MKARTCRPVAAIFAAAVVLAATLALPPAAKAEKNEVIESYSAFIISSTPGSRQRARLSISRWSTDEERTQLKEVLAGGDALAFRDAVGKLEQAGTFQFADSLGYPVRYARKFEYPDGSWQIIAGTDKPLSGAEVLGTNSQRDYLLAIIEITSDPEGNLQAVVSPDSELIWDETTQTIDLKNWSGMVFGLSHVRRLK